MFRRILIANRGEVAARVARTCARMGISTVAVASEADRSQQWLKDVDRVVCIGPARASASYLDQDALIEVARQTGCSAVHPGWGFLAENELFAARCASAGLTFLGPSPAHLKGMGDKAQARKTMKALGLPLIPGSDGPVATVEEARREAERIGFPILLKAVAGGGGRGMRVVTRREDVEEAFRNASAEAVSSFGDGRMYVERQIQQGRHIEVQVLGDAYGEVAIFGERECSVQRRHQKVLEEAPSPGLSSGERSRIIPLVRQALSKAGYRNAGTVEMLMDEEGSLYFMEMNTRLQVEHPVSEAIFGVDLVEWQLRVAANEPLPKDLLDKTPSGHAIECRINAEDPENDFRPGPGQVTTLQWPEGEGIRVDTHLRAGDTIPPQYDSMIAKLIVHASTRELAIERMESALQRCCIEGVKTNIALHQSILRWPEFRSGNYHTQTLETKMREGTWRV